MANIEELENEFTKTDLFGELTSRYSNDELDELICNWQDDYELYEAFLNWVKER